MQTITRLVLLAFISTSTSWAVADKMEGTDVERLRRGEILLQTIHSDLSGGAARVSALFHTDAQSVWNIIGYCKYEYIYVKGLELCEVVVPGLFLTQKRHRVNNSWYAPTMDYTFEASRTSPTHGEFHLVSGDLKVMEGQWNFVPLPDSDSMVVVHEIRLQSQIPSPRWLVRRVLKRDLPDMLACIRGLARASGDESRVSADLVRCPGDVGSIGK